MSDNDYAARLAQEQEIFREQVEVNDLPEIFHYWSNKYLRTWTEELGFSNPDQMFCRYLLRSAQRCDQAPIRFVSIGAGNCDTEVRVAKLLLAEGLRDFVIECLDINQAMLARGAEFASSEGVAEHVVPLLGDFNRWIPAHRYSGVMANQSLHHVVELEHLFDAVRACLHPQGLFVVSDMIGRNGHLRWPAALRAVRRIWQQLPERYRYNLQLKRHEAIFEDWDCSVEGFEGVRAQHIMPLLLERFGFEMYCAYGNIIDPFIDRSFGHHFDPQSDTDRAFIDAVQDEDEKGIQDGHWPPTHMVAAMCLGQPQQRERSRALQPESAIHQTSLEELLSIFRDAGGTDEPFLQLHHARHRQVHQQALRGGYPRRVLDLDSHYLQQSAVLALGGASVTAIGTTDTLDREAIKAAARELNMTIMVAAPEQQSTLLSSLPEAEFDLICLGEVNRYSQLDSAELWVELWRLLSPGGRVVVSAGNDFALGHLLREPMRLLPGAHRQGLVSMRRLRRTFSRRCPELGLHQAHFLPRVLPEGASLMQRAAARIESWVKTLRPRLYLELTKPTTS